MKIAHKLVALAFVSFAALSVKAQTITGFGSNENFTLGFNTFGTRTQSTTSLTLSGSDAGSTTVGFLTGLPAINSFTTIKLRLVATLSGASNIGSTFSIDLGDVDGETATWSGNWSSFTLNSPTTVDLVYSPSATAFNGTPTSFTLNTGGSGATLNVVLDSLSIAPAVVPEPSTYASIAGVAVLGLVAYRRRRRA